jgi:hypothetical protein
MYLLNRCQLKNKPILEDLKAKDKQKFFTLRMFLKNLGFVFNDAYNS